MKTRNLLLIIILLNFGACNSINSIISRKKADAELYKRSIADAIHPDESKVINYLVPVNKENNNLIWKNIGGEDYILVVSWKQNISYYKPYLDSAFYDTGLYSTWITTAPELRMRMQKEKVKKTKDMNRRLIQLLGLPPNSVYSYFVEFWVKPTDLFRPCPDDEITDQKCDICFPPGTNPYHIKWINENRISRYYNCDLYNQYPWTQLGYTYDWNPRNRTHIGLSEFVIPSNSKIVVKAIYTTKEYLQLDEAAQ